MDVIGILLVGCTGAFRAGFGVWKNHSDMDFEFKVKKAVPTVVLGFAVGAAIGAQDLPLDGNLELGLELMASFGVTVAFEEGFKGLWRGYIQDSRFWKAIKQIVSG